MGDKIAVCPKHPKEHATFVTTAHEAHDWLVDPKGEFLEDRGCTEIAVKPDRGNIWTCAKCGAEAVFREQEPLETKKVRVALVRVLIDVSNDIKACDSMNSLLTDNLQIHKGSGVLLDWQYEEFGGPTEVEIPVGYKPDTPDFAFPSHPAVKILEN